MIKKLKILFYKLLLRKPRKSKLDIDEIKKILVYRIDRIGDMVLTFPLVEIIKNKYPNIQIDFYASQTNNILAASNSNIDNIYVDDKKNSLKSFFTLLKLRKNNYDLVLDMYENRFSNTLLRIKVINAKNNICLQKYRLKGLKESDFKFYNAIYAKDKKKHILDKNLEMLDFFNIKSKKFSNELHVDTRYYKKAKQYINEQKVNIVFNIQGSNEERTIKDKDLRILFLELSSLTNVNINLISLPDNYKRVYQILSSISNENIKLIETQNIYEAVALIDLSDIVISPDTSIIHIASMLNKKIVGIYSQNEDNYLSFHPFSSDYKVVRAECEGNGVEVFNLKEVIAYVKSYI